MSSENLKLVVVYHAPANEYSVAAHNQTPDEAEKFRQEWNPHLVEGASLIVLDQRKRHSVQDAQACRACRETVARSAHLQPQPKFVRRKS